MSYIKFWDHNNQFHDRVEISHFIQNFSADGLPQSFPPNTFRTRGEESEEEAFFLDFVVIDRPNETSPYLKKRLYQKVMTRNGIAFLSSFLENGEPKIEPIQDIHAGVVEMHMFYNALDFLEISLNRFGTYDFSLKGKIPKYLYLPKVIECLNREDKGWHVASYFCMSMSKLVTKPYVNAFVEAACESLQEDEPEVADYLKGIYESDNMFDYAIKNVPLTQRFFGTSKELSLCYNMLCLIKQPESHKTIYTTIENFFLYFKSEAFASQFVRLADSKIDYHINKVIKDFNIIPQIVERFETENC
jgi:hypothetical protein